MKIYSMRQENKFTTETQGGNSITVRAIWEFDVDDSWGETKEDCINIAKEEFKTIKPEDAKFEVLDDTSYPYPTVS